MEEESIFNKKEHICMSVSQISKCFLLCVYQRRQNISQGEMIPEAGYLSLRID